MTQRCKRCGATRTPDSDHFAYITTSGHSAPWKCFLETPGHDWVPPGDPNVDYHINSLTQVKENLRREALMANIRPMLAQSVQMDDIGKYIHDDDYVSQFKADGQRLLIRVEDGHVDVLGRNGQNKTTGLSYQLLAQFEAFKEGTWLFDGELIGTDLVLFDMPQAGGLIGPADNFIDRWAALNTLYTQVWKPDHNVVTLLPVSYTTDEKLTLARRAEKEGREGIMFRNRQGTYKFGARSSHLLKAKFVKEADCIVARVGVDGHDNVELAVLDPEFNNGEGRIVNIGRASAIGKKPKPQVMDVWEVRYLYMVDPTNPRLYQPRLVRKRTDKDASECLWVQVSNSFTDKQIVQRTRAEM